MRISRPRHDMDPFPFAFIPLISETSRCNASEIRSPVAANKLINVAYVFGRNESEAGSRVAARTGSSIFAARIDMGGATCLTIAKVVRRWRFVTRFLHATVLSNVVDGLVVGVPWRHRSRLTSPVDRCCCSGMRLPFVGREDCEATQQNTLCC